MATNELLAYYGCEFAEGKSKKVDIPFRSAIQDFTYEKNYLTNYVEKKIKGPDWRDTLFPTLTVHLQTIRGFLSWVNSSRVKSISLPSEFLNEKLCIFLETAFIPMIIYEERGAQCYPMDVVLIMST